MIRQELASEHGIVIGLRSVELRVQPWRRELRARRQATMRFETRPGHQLQIDFGDTKVWTGEERIKIHLFVATLGYSRRYERGSILITSNRLVGEWGGVFGDPMVASAILDRLLHRKPGPQVGRWIESKPPGNEHELDLRTAVEGCSRSLPCGAWLMISAICKIWLVPT